MKYIKAFEMYSRWDSEILNEILNTITSIKRPKPSIYDYKLYPEINTLWIAYKYSARSNRDKLEKLDKYNENNILIKSMLESSIFIESVSEIKKNGRKGPFSPKYNKDTKELDEVKLAGLQKPNVSVYSLQCKIKEEYIPIILKEINAKTTAKNYNL